MFALLICILTLHSVSACNVPDICTENTAIQAEIVEQHNAYRRSVEPTAADMLIMNWSDEVAASARNWVDRCELAHGPPSTRMLQGYELGENLFFASALHTWDKVVSAWHSEVANYQYPNGSINGGAIGHYTQIVWNSSYKVGCAGTLCKGNVYYYGCHYYRAGNFRRVPPYKVGPPCASCPDACENKLCTNPCPYVNTYRNCPAMKNQWVGGCGNALVHKWCPAECKCANEIFPPGAQCMEPSLLYRTLCRYVLREMILYGRVPMAEFGEDDSLLPPLNTGDAADEAAAGKTQCEVSVWNGNCGIAATMVGPGPHEAANTSSKCGIPRRSSIIKVER
ncbi:cysteine-rich venom protein pseudecin [Diretmus argenteus]